MVTQRAPINLITASACPVAAPPAEAIAGAKMVAPPPSITT